MTGTNALIGFPRVTDKFTLSGGSWEADYPQSNLLVLPLSDVARTTDAVATSSVIIGTSSQTRRIGLIGLPRHNMRPATRPTIRVRLYGDAAMTSLLVDTGTMLLWPEVYPYARLEWEDDTYWTGTYTDDQLADTTWMWFYWFERDWMAAAFRIDIDDSSNADEYIELGNIEVAAAFEVTYNFQWGGQYGFQPRTTADTAIGGAKYFDRQDKPRVFKGAFWSPRDEAMTHHFERWRQLDEDTPFLFIPHPDEPLHYLRTAMFCRQLDPGLFSYTQLGIDTVPISLEEVIG